MKKGYVMVLAVAVIVVSFIGIYFSPSSEKKEYLRIHIRADSNLTEDQNVKYKVKDAVVEFLTPLISTCTSKEKAISVINSNLNNIESVSDKVLKENGFNYRSKAIYKKEEFPTRIYEEVTLEAGIYDSLIINLGSGSGDNWWCVVYPPLCFTSSNLPYIYRSKIIEIIRNFFPEK